MKLWKVLCYKTLLKNYYNIKLLEFRLFLISYSLKFIKLFIILNKFK